MEDVFQKAMAIQGPKTRAKGRKKVAIVGSGCAGLGAAWALKSTEYEVHIFEKEARLGGHTNTQTWTRGAQSVPVDTGFIVMNSATYPNFIKFLKEVGVDTVPTEMSFGVSRDQGKFEWSGSGKGAFAQRRNLLRPGHWRMIFDIIRFNVYALDLLDRSDTESRTITLGEYLDMNGYSQAFRDDYLIPMTAAVWSTSPDKASLEFPAHTLIRFMWNHHLLSTISTRPDWLTIPGCSQKYVDAIVESLGDRLKLHLSSKVISLVPASPAFKANTRLSWYGGGDEEILAPHSAGADDSVRSDYFHHVILACHGDQVLPILTDDAATERRDSKGVLCTSEPMKEEADIFSAFKTTENICYLHSDLSLMPTRPDTWSSWNYMINSNPSKLSHPAGVSLTYNMNILQHISTRTYGNVMVTMNPNHPPRDKLTQGKYIYRHPLYTVEAVRAQEKLETIQNKRGISFCGAWTKYGFHEDGFSSGLKVANDHLGATLPFDFKDSTYSRGYKPQFTTKHHAIRLGLMLTLIGIRIIEFVAQLPVVSFFIAAVGFIASSILDWLENSGFIA